MKIHQLYTGSSLRNFCYLIESHVPSQFYCVDPWDAGQVSEWLGDDKSLVAVMNTHEHWDHVRGNLELKRRYECEIWAHDKAGGLIESVDRLLCDGEVIDLGDGASLLVMDTPGHTMAHLCLLYREADIPKAVITGDTLFNAGVGNCHHGGNPEVLYETIVKRFGPLGDDVYLLPGHEYLANNLNFTLSREPANRKALELRDTCSTQGEEGPFFVSDLGLEREINTFLRLDNPEIVSRLKMEGRSDKEIFLTLRKLRDKW